MMLRARGFTLLELIVVIFIIGVVSTFALLTREDEVDLNRLIIEAEKASNTIFNLMIQARNSQTTVDLRGGPSSGSLLAYLYVNKKSNQLYTGSGNVGIGALNVGSANWNSYTTQQIFFYNEFISSIVPKGNPGRTLITSDGHFINYKGGSSISRDPYYFELTSNTNTSIKVKVEFSPLGYPRMYVSDQRINNGQYREIIR
jgi:prepilin-type N-terminal cleavage/methylation domain-containing protein